MCVKEAPKALRTAETSKNEQENSKVWRVGGGANYLRLFMVKTSITIGFDMVLSFCAGNDLHLKHEERGRLWSWLGGHSAFCASMKTSVWSPKPT